MSLGSLALGVDLGQAQDPSALVAVQSYRPEPTHAGDWPEPRYLIRWVERIPLGTDYPGVVQRIATTGAAAHTWGSTVIVLDGTGVGRPVVDLLRRATSLPVRAVVFTAGDHEAQPEYAVHRVPKRDLVTSLEVVLQTRRLEVVPDCPLQQELAQELGAFDFSLNARGHDTYEASRGSHDDLVAALALALWWLARQARSDGWLAWEARRAADPARYGPRLGDQLG